MEKPKELTFIKSGKYTLAMLTCLILVSPFVISGIETVQADPYYFTLWAALDATEPYIGWNAGYHDIMQAVKNELAKIGINLELTFWDPGGIWDICWDWRWDKPGIPPTGWDLTTGEQWLYLIGLTGMGRFVYKEGVPPAGCNIGPWLNLKADEIYKMAEAELDPVKRRELLWKWQELYMHDCPMINLFYTIQYEVQPKWFYGYDYSCRYGDMRWNTRLEETSPGHYGNPNKPNGTITFAIDETMYAGVNPLFCETYGTEAYSSMVFDCLYACTRYPYPPSYNDTLWNATNLEKYSYKMAPQIAAGMPVYYDGGRTVLVPIRDDVYWVWPENESIAGTLNAHDVKFTFDATIDPKTGTSGYGDYAPILKSVEVVSNDTLQNDYPELWNGYTYPADQVFPWMDNNTVQFREPYAVKVNLKRTHADFELLFGRVWGSTILPKFLFEGVPYIALRSHPTQYKPELWPQTGPFLLDSYVPDYEVVLKKNPHWWGTQKGYLGTVNKFIIKFTVDPAIRKEGLFSGDFEICDAPIAHVNEFEAQKWKKVPGYPVDADQQYNGFNVYTEPRANSANMIRLNLNNPILANRYVRMAIAHAIPYFAPASLNIPDIIRGWGLYCEFPGHAVPLTEAIHPYTVLGGQYCYHPTLEPYGYDLDKARYYLSLYLNQTKAGETVGPVGDADQSGLVDGTDWGIWRTSPLTGTWPDPTGWIYPTWPFTVDPDWDNDGDADGVDKSLWGDNYGTEYRS